MATVTNYPIDLSILVIDAQIFVAINKFQFLPNKLIPTLHSSKQSIDSVITHNINMETENREHGSAVSPVQAEWS